ncbi:MAG: aminopeptidase [Bacteroidales bacterium]|nr:aminopeptidase [Bacteroidales bacterium]
MKFLKVISILIVASAAALPSFAQKSGKKVGQEPEGYIFTTVKANPVTSVKDQHRTGTCWCFAGISFLESEAIRKGAPQSLDLSEMFVVSKSYTERAVKYVRLDKNLRFAPGSDFGDVLDVVREFGIVPNDVMTGLNYGETAHAHDELSAALKGYVKAVAGNPNNKLSTAWLNGLNNILAAYLGEIPQNFVTDGKEYTPKNYLESLGLNMDDYISISSFTHHPFYEKFVIEVPDNWRWTESYNVPMDEMLEIMDYAIENGYTVGWTADMSEKSFASNGIATIPDVEANERSGSDQDRWLGVSRAEKEAILYNVNAPGKEKVITQEMRQEGYDNKQTTDDHAMHIFGIAKDQNGTKYYMVKNSWGEFGDYKGNNYASESYVKYKTMNILVNKAAVPSEILDKLGIGK